MLGFDSFFSFGGRYPLHKISHAEPLGQAFQKTSWGDEVEATNSGPIKRVLTVWRMEFSKMGGGEW